MQIPDQWTFKNPGVAAHFDEHVNEQLPWYPMVTRAVAHIVRHYLPEKGIVFDVGASTGNIGRALKEVLQDRKGSIVAFEPSSEMRDRYSAPNDSIHSALMADTAQTVPYHEGFDVCVFMLTLMFTPVKDRLGILDKCLGAMKEGGCVIIVDREEPASGSYFDTVMWRLVLAEKLQAGADPADVTRKEMSLAGVQIPLQRGLIQAMGGREFFRFGAFVGWIVTFDAFQDSRSAVF